MSVVFKEVTPSIKQVFLYTWKLRPNRFEYSKRDVLPNKIQVIERLVYSKNKKGEFTIPDERLTIVSFSNPQYKPYTKLKKDKSGKQRVITHQYNCIISIGKDKDKQFSMDSKIVWRVGSFKTFVKPPQAKIRSIYKSTEASLRKRVDKYKTWTPSQKSKWIRDQIRKYKISAPFLNVGDYAARALGINLDSYYRIYPLQVKFGCLYGPPTQVLPSTHPYDKDLKYPFFDKHMIAIIFMLLQRNVLKKSNYLEQGRT